MSVQKLNPQNDVGVSLLNFKVIQDHSDLFRAECTRLMEETNKACKRMQDDDKKRLDQRVKDIHFLKKELEQKLEEIIFETDNLLTLHGRVQKALEACNDPLRVAVLCIDERWRRVPQERVHDAVERELVKEREDIEGVTVLLKRVAQQLTEQIRLNRSSRFHLEQDLKEKFEAQTIDKSCILMTAHSVENLQESPNKALLPTLSVTPMQWENFSEVNLAKAEQQKNNSMSLRSLTESLLGQTAADLQKQRQATTEAFQLNVQELKKDKGNLEEQLSKTLLEHNKQQTICAELLLSIEENERCLSLAQARLSLRHQRPAKEQCFDPAQAQLLSEAQQISAYVNKLREAVARSQDEQRALVRCELELQENIKNKSEALYIDEVVCAQHREPIVFHNF